MPGGPTTVGGSPSIPATAPPRTPKRGRSERAPNRSATSAAAFLCDASKRLSRSLELEDTLQCMADLCVPEMGQAYIAYLFNSNLSEGRIAVARHADAGRQPLLEALARQAFSDTGRLQPLVEIACTRRWFVLSQLKTAVLIGDGRPAHVLQSDLRLKTALLIPIANGEHVLGISIFLADSTRWYTPRQVRLASELCDRFALAVTAAQMYDSCRIALDASQELLATTMHDLMSPLTYIKGSAQRLRRLDWGHIDQMTTSEVDKRLSAIDGAVTRMASAMSALMATTRPEPPMLTQPLVTDMTDLMMVVQEVVGLEQLVAPNRAIHLVHSTTEPIVGNWDTAQIQRLLGNLISNAVKYSPPASSVEVDVRREADSEGHWAVVAVSDRGIGIPAGDLPFVFEPFHRGSNVGDVAGTGLGLASVWHTVRTHQGRLGIESEQGKGTCITVRLPLA